MRTNQNFGILYILMLICQIVICNFSPIGPYVVLTALPAMVLCIPLTVSIAGCMVIAFLSGLAVDWLSEGIIGLNAAAALPAAFLRRGMIRIFLGEDLITRGDRFSFKKNGVGKISVALILNTAVFLTVYILLDGAGTRPVWFNMTRLGVSLALNFLLGLIVTGILTPDDRK